MLMRKLTEQETLKRIKEYCDPLGIEFIGWVGGSYQGDSTRMILKSINGITWNTTDFHHLKRLRTGYRNQDGTAVGRFLTPEKAEERLKNSGCIYEIGSYVYTDYFSPVELICHEKDPITGKEHGPFMSNYRNIIDGLCGCPRCGRFYHPTVDEWVEKAKIIHDGKGYDYSKVTYIPTEREGYGGIPVVCPTHGIFYTDARGHINNKIGCPACCSSSNEQEVHRYLMNHGYDFIHDSGIIKVGKNNARPDFRVTIGDENFIIETNGEHHYSYNKFLNHSYKRYLRQIERDRELRLYCETNNIYFLEIPYLDKNRINDILDAFFGPDHKDITTHIDPDTTPPGSQ